MTSQAYLSECRKFRYWLFRQWNPALQTLSVIGVNPSTADEEKNDATIRKDMGFAARLNCGSILKLNVGAFRSTDPRIWREAPDPIGPDNTPEALLRYSRMFDVYRVVAAWGKNGAYAPEQSTPISDKFDVLWCWGKNGDGTPRHPLMLPYSTNLEVFYEPGMQPRSK